MLHTTKQLFLASKSPRRRKLLKDIGLSFKSFSVDTDEKLIPGESPISTVKRLASEKMSAAETKIKDGIILTADTIVVLDGEIIGKPDSKNEAKRILKKLSNNKHFVYTGFCIKSLPENIAITNYVKTSVFFKDLSSAQIEEYVAGGSPMDKAGAYGIQDDYGAVFVEKINGCYYNVVGLPVSKVYESLNEIVDALKS